MERMEKAILKDVSLDELGPRPQKPKNPVDHWSHAVLLERGAYLRKMAKFGDGSASETLKEYPQHAAMLSFRSRSGEAEIHERFADLFIVLSGAATLVDGRYGRRRAHGRARRDTRRVDRRRHAAESAAGRRGACAGRHAASDAAQRRRDLHMPGHESAGSCLGPAETGALRIGAGDRDRTGDIQLGKLTFCH